MVMGASAFQMECKREDSRSEVEVAELGKICEAGAASRAKPLYHTNYARTELNLTHLVVTSNTA